MKTYITTPIYYPNGRPHIGHAYTSVLADAFTRMLRMQGGEVWFTTGTDENGQKMQEYVEKSGITAKEYLDQREVEFRAMAKFMEVDYNDYIRTTYEKHIKTVQGILTDVYNKGLIEKKAYTGLYCKGCEQFKLPQDLDAKGCCPDHQVKPVEITEENYFFKMEPFRQKLIDHLNRNPDFIKPANFQKEVMNMIKEPLEDLCISRPKRRVHLGIELPFDKDFVSYVWFDALINYVTLLDYPNGAKMKDWWPVVHHLIGKDILKPHAIYWPCMLMAMELPLPKHLLVHGYWTGEGGIKMSKSIGNIVDPEELVTEIGGADPLRFYLLRNMTGANDAQVSRKLILETYSQLANNIGNLMSRSVKLSAKHFDGKAPKSVGDKHLLAEIESDLKKALPKQPDIELFSKYVETVFQIGTKLNVYFAGKEPWVLAKDPQKRQELADVLYTTLEGLRLLSAALYPIMPVVSGKILKALSADSQKPLKGSEVLDAEGVLFPRIEEKEKA